MKEKKNVNETLACAEISPKASNGMCWLRWIVTYPVKKVIGFSNYWGQKPKFSFKFSSVRIAR